MFLPAYRDIAAVMQRTGMQESRNGERVRKMQIVMGILLLDMVLIASAISRAGVYLGIR